MEAGTRPSRAAQRRRGASAGAKTDPPVARRVRVRVDGTVQGVGFRPFVYRLARELSLGGFICNDEHGVLIDAEGPAAAVDALLERVAAEAPPLARVEGLRVDDAEPTGATPFTIAPSRGGGHAEVLVSPDVATCDQCLAEVLDPADRRHRYPFTNCTNCGPRFTIVRDVPYDRPLTTMAGFPLCDECRAEYTDPLDRRFHAQPVACARCGPQLRLIEAPGRDVGAEWSAVLPVAHPRDAISATAAAITAGRIVAVKGLGGYHLACRADNEHAVATLRARKHREDKPFALMVGNLEGARRLVELAGPERELLVAPERPIVIARRRAGVDGAVAPSVAPHGPDLGLMLPYTPLHHLLLADVTRLTGVPGVALVMTSGNVSDEPIAFDDADARKRLASIADLFCVHDRPIYVRADDSVVRATDPELATGPLVIRRSRGWAPRSTDLPWSLGRPVLGVGAELKSTFCVAKGTRAWVGPHVGDLKNWETLESFREGIAHLQRLFAVEPEVVAHDLHPDYLSTCYAMEREGVERVAVQHHHAHLAACLAEHGETGEAVGAIFDGAGYGTDGTVWGGELLVGGLAGFERRGRLLPVRLPGGDAATREPWRMACAWLAAAEGEA
ncbi:MAG: carbamoyltransferase HypF, partial [Solirubrobacterales bacterium]